jgi:uncharacterized protein
LISVSALHIYPIKGCGGISLHQADVTGTGFRFDRRWMFVDDAGMFVAQRDSRGLGVAIRSACLIRTAIGDRTLTITAPSMPPLIVPLQDVTGAELPVTVWDDSCTAIDQGADAGLWATEFLSRERPGRYRLVRMADGNQRRSKVGDGRVAFGDAYPFLVVSDSSLADLNRRLDEPLPMNRFRPNIVLAGSQAYQEDELDGFRINGIDFVGATLCIRCPTTTTNQDTAERGKEPLRTLAAYRKQPDGVVFGRNFNHSGSGSVKVGDAIAPR